MSTSINCQFGWFRCPTVHAFILMLSINVVYLSPIYDSFLPFHGPTAVVCLARQYHYNDDSERKRRTETTTDGTANRPTTNSVHHAAPAAADQMTNLAICWEMARRWCRTHALYRARLQLRQSTGSRRCVAAWEARIVSNFHHSIRSRELGAVEGVSLSKH